MKPNKTCFLPSHIVTSNNPGDWADVLKSGFFVLIDKATGKLFHKYLPSHDKKIGEEGFDLGTEIKMRIFNHMPTR